MMSRMKKGIVLMLALVMMFSVSLTAFASSPSQEGGVSGGSSEGGADDNSLVGGNVAGASVNVVGISPMASQTITDALAATGLKAQGWKASDAVAFADVSALVNGKAVSQFDGDGYVTVRLGVPAVKKTSNVAVLHWKSTGGVETLAYEIPADGLIDIKMSSFSQVAVLVSGSAASVGATSPKTGESNAAELIVLAGMIALAGSMVMSRRKEYR